MNANATHFNVTTEQMNAILRSDAIRWGKSRKAGPALTVCLARLIATTAKARPCSLARYVTL